MNGLNNICRLCRNTWHSHPDIALSYLHKSYVIVYKYCKAKKNCATSHTMGIEFLYFN